LRPANKSWCTPTISGSLREGESGIRGSPLRGRDPHRGPPLHGERRGVDDALRLGAAKHLASISGGGGTWCFDRKGESWVTGPGRFPGGRAGIWWPPSREGRRDSSLTRSCMRRFGGCWWRAFVPRISIRKSNPPGPTPVLECVAKLAEEFRGSSGCAGRAIPVDLGSPARQPAFRLPSFFLKRDDQRRAQPGWRARFHRVLAGPRLPHYRPLFGRLPDHRPFPYGRSWWIWMKLPIPGKGKARRMCHRPPRRKGACARRRQRDC